MVGKKNWRKARLKIVEERVEMMEERPTMCVWMMMCDEANLRSKP